MSPFLGVQLALAHPMTAGLVPGTGLGDMLAHPFMRQAFLAGLPIAALAGVVGYFMVLRGQVFTGDALSHVAFTGALAALAFGVDVRLGLFTATIGIGAVLGLLGHRGQADDVLIGTVFAWILGLGVLALSVYTAGAHAATSGGGGVSVLFGSIFGLSSTRALAAAGIAIGLLVISVLIARPLLFASLDEAVAAARGVPVTALGIGFLALVGACAAEATQAVGALLLLGLLAAPAGVAHRLTRNPYHGLALSAGLSLAAMAVGLTASYLVPQLPPSFSILAVASVIYAAAFLLPAGRAVAPASTNRSSAGNVRAAVDDEKAWAQLRQLRPDRLPLTGLDAPPGPDDA